MSWEQCIRQLGRWGPYEPGSMEIRDLPILGVPVRLFLWRFRVECPSCGPRLEALNWLAPRARVSSRMAEDVARLCRVLPIKHVAERFGLGLHTVKAIDKAWLERTLPELDMTGVEKLLMDEFAIHKGHHYATVITDADSRRVLWVGHGRGREAVQPFFASIGKEACARIRAVGMDMHAPSKRKSESTVLGPRLSTTSSMW